MPDTQANPNNNDGLAQPILVARLEGSQQVPKEQIMSVTLQLLKISTSRIRPNPNQPRRVITQGAIDAMEASLREIGQQTPAKVRALTEAERLDDPNHDYELIGGHIRHAGALKAGLETLDCLVLDLTPEQVKLAGLVDNRSTDMHWLDWASDIQDLYNAQTEKSQRKLADQLGLSVGRINSTLKVASALNQTSRDLIVHDVNTSGLENAVLERPVIALADLDDPELVEKALPVLISQKLTELQAKGLVGHVKAGNPPDTYNPAQKPPKAKATHSSPLPAELADKIVELPTPANGHHKEPLAQPSLAPRLVGSAQVHPSSQEPENWFWQLLVGIKFISQLRSRAKKGELTLTDRVLILLYWVFVKPFVFLFGHLGKLLKEAGKGIWHSIKEATGKTFTRILEWAVPLLIICVLIWGAGKVYQWVVVNPLHWLGSEIKSGFHWGGSHAEEPVTPTMSASPVPVTSASKPQVERHALSAPISPKKEMGVTYQPSVSFAPPASPSKTLFDPKILDIEMAAIPKNSIVKDYPFTPDETMPGDLAVSRLQDLTDTDRYTMKMGSGTEKIISITPTTTNLVLNYKSGDALGGFLDGSGPLNFFWEDVKYIHTNAIDSGAGNVLYQCSLVVSGAKHPLTIQCSRPEDLEHLVSTLEYFIRSSRLGHDAQPAGMPYLFQGLVLNNDRVVDKLWANSPMDKAGVALGDHLWSVGKIAPEQQGRKDLEAGLQPSAIVYTVSPADWDKALTASRLPGQSITFRPKLRKITLSSP